MKSVYKLNFNNDIRRFIAEFENLDDLKKRVENCYHLEKDSFLIKQKGKIINDRKFNKIISRLEIPVKFEIELKSEEVVKQKPIKEKSEDLNLKNFKVILSFFSENISKKNLINLIVGVTKTIPKEQLTCILKSLLSSSQLQEMLIESIHSLINNMELDGEEKEKTFQTKQNEKEENEIEVIEETFEITEEESNQIDDTKQPQHFLSTQKDEELDDLMKELLNKQIILEEDGNGEEETEEIVDQWNKLEELVLQEHHFILDDENKGDLLFDQQHSYDEEQEIQQEEEEEQEILNNLNKEEQQYQEEIQQQVDEQEQEEEDNVEDDDEGQVDEDEFDSFSFIQQKLEQLKQKEHQKWIEQQRKEYKRKEEEEKRRRQQQQQESKSRQEEEEKKRIEEQEELKRIEEQQEKKRIEEQQEELKRIEEQQELKRIEQEELKRIEERLKEEKKKEEEEEELKRKKEEERMKELKRIEEEQLVKIVLENNEISFLVFEKMKELGCVDSHGYEPILSLIIKHKGNVEQVANEIFP